MCTYEQLYTDHQQNMTYATNRGKLKNQSLLQTTHGTSAVLTNETKYLAAIQLVTEHGSGQKHYFPSQAYIQ